MTRYASKGGRPKNVVSRTRAWALRAAELLDDGLTDAKAAAKLCEEFDARIPARAVTAFRRAEYDGVQAQRLELRERARAIRLILEGAEDSGVSFASAGQALLARTLYEILEKGASGDREMSVEELKAAGVEFGRIISLNIEQERARIEIEKRAAAERIKTAARNAALKPEDLVAKVDELMGLKT